MLRTKIFTLLISGIVCTGCLQEDFPKKAFDTYSPEDIHDGHIISTPEAEGMDGTALEQVYEQSHSRDDLWQLRSLLVFRHGNLVAESYMKDDADRTTPRAIWSCTKQVLGIVTGIAVEKGLIEDIDDPISKYMGTKSYPDKADITIRNLLTMNSGIDYSNDGVNGETSMLLQNKPDRLLPYILGLPMREPQGTSFHYNDGDPHVVSALLQHIVDRPMDEWADEQLFARLGIQNIEWRRYKDGTTLGGYGILTTPRELAKIAICVVDTGSFKGDQLVSKQWIKEMTTSHESSAYKGYDFGYYWWKDPGRNIIFTWGHGGQFAFICPDYDIIVIITSEPNTQGDHEVSADEALPIVDAVLDAVRE